MMPRRLLLTFVASMALSTAAPAYAQGTVGDVVGFLVTNQAVPTADFEKDRAAADAARSTMANALLINLTSTPLATASSGFLYRLNPQLGTVERATESFGGFFIERALTPGRGRASFGVSATSVNFTRLNGRSLHDGTLVTVANRFRDEGVPFDTESLTLRLRSSTMTFFGSVGVTDRLEIAAAVPFVRLTLDGQRLNVYRGSQLVQASGTATASGVGDMALRAKATVVEVSGGGVALAGELRLPTGDALNLLGSGKTSVRGVAIGSFERGHVALHANAAVVGGGISSELDFGGGASMAVHPRVTLSAEFLTRHVSKLHPIDLVGAPHPVLVGVETLRLSAGTGGGVIASAITGLKWNLGRTMVIGGHLIWSLANHGLTAPVTPTLAFEYAF